MTIGNSFLSLSISRISIATRDVSCFEDFRKGSRTIRACGGVDTHLLTGGRPGERLTARQPDDFSNLHRVKGETGGNMYTFPHHRYRPMSLHRTANGGIGCKGGINPTVFSKCF